MTELLNMDLSHPPVPSDQWARQSPAWSQPYSHPALVTNPGVFTRPGYTTRPGTPMTAIVPVAAVSAPVMMPEPVTTTDRKAIGSVSNKLVIGAIAMGLLMGVSALLALTSGVENKRVAAGDVMVQPVQATQAAKPTQAEPPKPVPAAMPAVNARASTTIDMPVSTLTAVVDGTKEKEKPATKVKPPKTHAAAITKHDKPTPTTPRTKTKTNAADADVANSRELLAKANEESTLR